MTAFFDTSVLVAAFWADHREHGSSIERFSKADKQYSYCGLHTLAEVYTTMTALPIKQRIEPSEALLFIQELRKRLTIISLTEEESAVTIEKAAELGFRSGMIYDALLMACAAKAQAEVIYTWNAKHFRGVDPEQAHKVRTP